MVTNEKGPGKNHHPMFGGTDVTSGIYTLSLTPEPLFKQLPHSSPNFWGCAQLNSLEVKV